MQLHLNEQRDGPSQVRGDTGEPKMISALKEFLVWLGKKQYLAGQAPCCWPFV